MEQQNIILYCSCCHDVGELIKTTDYLILYVLFSYKLQSCIVLKKCFVIGKIFILNSNSERPYFTSLNHHS